MSYAKPLYFDSNLQGGTGPTGPTGPIGHTGAGGAQGYWGSFWSDVSQNNPVASTTNIATYSHADPDNFGVVLDGVGPNYNQIKVLNDGVYNIQFSAQIQKTDSETDFIDIWLAINNNTIPDTNGRIRFSGLNDSDVPSWNYMLKLYANDIIQLYWLSADTQIALVCLPINGVVPLTPSIITTVQQVMYTQQGPTGPTGQIGPMGVTGPTGPQQNFYTNYTITQITSTTGGTGFNIPASTSDPNYYNVYQVDTTNGPLNINLPLISSLDNDGLRIHYIVDSAGELSNNNLIIGATGGDTIGGETSATIVVDYSSVQIMSNKSDKWLII